MFFDARMKTLVPRALRKGETIGLISPSSHCSHPERIQQAVLYLEKNGYRVKPARHLNRIDTDPAIADREKLQDLHEMFSDRSVKAVICLRGGAGASRLLKKIDYGLIAEHPKIFVGYSDITALSLAILSQTGLITFSGPMLATELCGPTPYTEEHFWGMLTSATYAHSLRNHPDHPVTALRKGCCNGLLIGGNLSVLSAMIGTPYLQTSAQALFFVEDINEPPYRIDRMLSHLGNAGLLSNSRGVLFGQFSWEPGEEAKDSRDDLRLEKIVEYYSRLLPAGSPVMRGLSYGHIRNLLTIPVGGKFKLTVTDSAFLLQALEPVVEE